MGRVRMNDMRWLLGSRLFTALWVTALGATACGTNPGDPRCDPNVNTCGTSGAAGAASTTSGGTTGGSGGSTPGVRTFDNRIVAYLPKWGGSLRNWATDMPWYRVTHVDIAFADPVGSTFSFGATQDMYLGAFVTAAHNAGAKVLVSIGGAGAGSTAIANLYVPAMVDTLVANLAAYLDAQNLDGVDVDVEGDPVNANYPAFIDKLVAAVRP